MKLSKIRAAAIAPALALLPARIMTSRQAELLLLAVGLQESGFVYRDQLESNGRDLRPGPAMGLWQFEQGGAVRGVLLHPLGRPHVLAVCEARGIRPSAAESLRPARSSDP